MIKIACVFFSLVCLAVHADAVLNPSEITKSGLTVAQAKRVLLVVLKHEKYRLNTPGMYIEDDLHGPHGEVNRPGYIDFSLAYDAENAGATNVLGNYSVNVLTGDVWEVEGCKRYRFSALGQLQSKIQAQTGGALASLKQAREEVGCP